MDGTGRRRKIQFINSYGKFHEYNFIREVLPNDDITVYSDTGYAEPATEEVREYYEKHGIGVVKAKAYSGVRPGILRKMLNILSGIRIVRASRKENYEYCFVHYLSTRRAILSFFVPKRTKLVLLTYGSDILRKKNFGEFFFKRMLKKAYLIVFNSGNLRYTFEKAYGDRYADKSVDIPFPCASFERLEKALEVHTKEEALGHFGLPTDKKIIVCGHTATEDERHPELIDAISKTDEKYLSGVHFVFPMTYGSGNYKNYREAVIKKLASSGLSYTVLTEYLPFDEMAMLHKVSDIHITSITTDALSFFMLEQMYAGAHLIYGEWLHYTEFEKGEWGADVYRDFEELPAVLSRVLDGKGNPTPDDRKRNIDELNSNERIKTLWCEVFARDTEKSV